MRAASEAVGLHPQSFGVIRRLYPDVIEYGESLSHSIRERTVDLSATIQRLSVIALERSKYLMEHAKDEIQAKVAADILDRNPETSKTQKIAVQSLSLTGKDVERLASAMVTGAGLKQQFSEAATGDFTPGLTAIDPFALQPGDPSP